MHENGASKGQGHTHTHSYGENSAEYPAPNPTYPWIDIQEAIASVLHLSPHIYRAAAQLASGCVVIDYRDASCALWLHEEDEGWISINSWTTKIVTLQPWLQAQLLLLTANPASSHPPSHSKIGVVPLPRNQGAWQKRTVVLVCSETWGSVAHKGSLCPSSKIRLGIYLSGACESVVS